MSRPRKWKRVYFVPRNHVFGNINDFSNQETIIMLVEEFEAIRLIDWEGLNQEECAKEMNVARTTVQKLYQDARVKIANCLVNGHRLKIEGGSYQLHENAKEFYGGSGCRQHRFHHYGRGRGQHRHPHGGPPGHGRGRHRYK